MKIEKISDNQIRFTLTGEDLAARQIKLSELAYGTEKARNLFREMMQQAASQVGFEADNIPLMIEAIPMSEGSIVLVVTKVENPEELDTRFAKFAPSVHDENDSDADDADDAADDTDDMLDLFKKLHANRKAAGDMLSSAAGLMKKEKEDVKDV